MSRYLYALIVVLLPAVMWPGEAVPSAYAVDWLNDPDGAADKANAGARALSDMGAGFWGAVGTASVGALYLLKRATPFLARLIPGWGPFVELGAEALWWMASTKNQKAADKAKDTVANAAKAALPIMETLRSLPPESLPPELVRLLNSQEVAQGLAVLAGVHDLAQHAGGRHE